MTTVRRVVIGGHAGWCLENGCVGVTILPGLGGKIISLKNLRSGREWCWHPGGTLRVFSNAYGDDFLSGPLAGIDECFPTIQACRHSGRVLPCHGEVWTEKWSLESDQLALGVVQVNIRPRQTPVSFQRSVHLVGSRICFEYVLENHGDSSEIYLWALHPLLRRMTGDRLLFSDQVRSLTIEGSRGLPGGSAKLCGWPEAFPGVELDRLCLGGRQDASIKAFTPEFSSPFARVHNEETGDSLHILADSPFVPYWGLWMARSGELGFRNVFAIEPTNAACDALTSVNPGKARILEPGETRVWQIVIQLGSLA